MIKAENLSYPSTVQVVNKFNYLHMEKKIYRYIQQQFDTDIYFWSKYVKCFRTLFYINSFSTLNKKQNIKYLHLTHPTKSMTFSWHY